MATINILVSLIGNSSELSLKQGTIDPQNDSLVTDVNASDTVIWSLDPNPDSGRNTNITLMNVKASDSSQPQYTNSQQILAAAEYTADANGVITGTVLATPPPAKPGQGANAKAFENYEIGFYKNSDATKTEIWDDPRLQMR